MGERMSICLVLGDVFWLSISPTENNDNSRGGPGTVPRRLPAFRPRGRNLVVEGCIARERGGPRSHYSAQWGCKKDVDESELIQMTDICVSGRLREMGLPYPRQYEEGVSG